MNLMLILAKTTGIILGIIAPALLVGAMVVVLPPTAPIGVLGLFAVVLLWTTPELRTTPLNALRKALFVFIVVDLCVPTYYTVQVPGLPWISVRRLTATVAIVLFALVISGSGEARKKINRRLFSDLPITFCFLGYLAMCFASIFTSLNASESISLTMEMLLTWYTPFFICLLIVETENDVITIMITIGISSLIVAGVGVTEYLSQHRIALDLIPTGLKEKLMADNPAFVVLVNSNPFRNGRYRASSIFGTAQSYGEFAAMTMPVGLYFLLHARKIRLQILGAAVVIAAIASLVACGSRGGFVSTLVAAQIFLLFWVVRNISKNPRGLMAPVLLLLIGLGTVVMVPAIAFVPAIHNIVLGGGETASSDEARRVQWEMAKPRIVQNPITGHGVGMGAEAVGFHTGGGILTLDTFTVTLLVETGVPGFLCFYGIIACMVWTGGRINVLGSAGKSASGVPRRSVSHSNSEDVSALGASLAFSAITLGVNKTVLSQRENMTLLFIFTAITLILSKLSAERVRLHVSQGIEKV